MEQLGAKIFLTNEIEEYTNEELKAISVLVNKEIEKRKQETMRLEWQKLVEQFNNFNKKYGITLEDSEQGEEYIMPAIYEEDCGRIYFF